MEAGTTIKQTYIKQTNKRNTGANNTEPCRKPKSWCCLRSLRTMFRSVVTVAKVTLVLLNLWVLAVVLVVSLGHWRVFDSTDPRAGYDNSHLIVMRELKEEAASKTGVRIHKSSTVQNAPNPVADWSNQALVAQEEFHPKALVLKEVEVLNTSLAPHQLSTLPLLSSKVANLRHWCKLQHPIQTPYDKIPPRKLNSILVDEKHKLLFCQIPGVAINEWRKILLILSGVVNATNTDAISGGDVFGKFAKLPKRLDEYGEKQRAEMLKNYYKAVFVRDPLERLVIAYRTKLLSKGSKYFHKAYGSLIIKKYRKKATPAEIKEGSDVKFSEFVKFIIDNEHAGAEALNEQWAQYYKQCHPCLVNYDYVGNFENVEKDTKFVIDKVKASKAIKPPYITDTKVVSQKELAKIYGTDISASELNNLFKIFSPDYTLFGYQCPSFVHELLKKGNIFHDY